MECLVEKHLTNRGHSVLWTPLQFPNLQPTEIIWTVGKNHEAAMSFAGIKMKRTMKHVRDGWYGNLKEFDPDGVPILNQEPNHPHH